MKKILLSMFGAAALLMFGCGGSDNSEEGGTPPQSMIADEKPDDGKGVGEYTEVQLNNPLNAVMVQSGQAIFDMKCASCHKTSEQRVVGPGFKGLTERRKPEWIMNMVTNPERMLDNDPTAKELLKECLVRMPNQNLSPEDARAVLEFAFSNDGVPVGK